MSNLSFRSGPILAVLAGLLLPGRARALDVPLRFHPLPSASQASVSEDAHRLVRWASPPPGNWKLPTLRSRTPVFSMVRLGGRKHLLILDKKNPGNPFYNRLFFDADADGDLTDEPVHQGRAFSRGMGFYYSTFPPLEVRIPLPGGTAPYRLEIRAHKRASFRGSRCPGARGIQDVALFMLTACDYRGTLQVGDRTFRLALTDANGNGLFGDTLEKENLPEATQEPSHRSDRIYLGPGPGLSHMEDLRTGGYLSLEGILYSLRFDQARGVLSLDPLPSPGGRIAFPLPTERLKLLGLEGAKDVLFLGAGREVQVPPGLYRLACYVLTRKDDGGNLWTLKAQAPPGAPPVRAGGEKPELLLFGEPFTPVVHVRARFPRRLRRSVVTAHLEFQVRGAGGEEVFQLSASSNRPSSLARSEKLPDLPKEPTFTILELPGERRVASGTFEYG